MGHVLEFYAIGWRGLQDSFGSGDEVSLAHLMATSEHNRLAGGERKISDERALQELLIGRSGAELRQRIAPGHLAAREVENTIADAFVDIVRSSGRYLGHLRHRTKAGPIFRDRFLGYEATHMVGGRIHLSVLWDRPLFGIRHSSYPGWGGLTRSELVTINGVLTERADAKVSPEFSAWWLDLTDLLAEAHGNNTDLITTYF